MPDIIEATVKFPANKWFDGKYGPYCDALFETDDIPEGEVKVYGNKGEDLGEALFELEKGDTYKLLYKGDGKAKLQDSDVAKLTGSNGQPPPQQGPPPGQAPPQGQAPPREQEQAGETSERKRLVNKAKSHANLIANTYAYLDGKFTENKATINQMPTPLALQKMAVSAAIEAVDNQ